MAARHAVRLIDGGGIASLLRLASKRQGVVTLTIINTKINVRTISGSNDITGEGWRSAFKPRSPPLRGEPKTYQHAERLLALLPTNRVATALFEQPGHTHGGGGDGPPPVTPQELNERALPEMTEWLKRAGYTTAQIADSGLRCVHVAGTKGKGSISVLTTSILMQQDRQDRQRQQKLPRPPIGTYLSPHLMTVRERILLDAQPISEQLFAKYFFELWRRLSEHHYFSAALPPEESETDAADEVSLEDVYSSSRGKPFLFRFLTLLALHIFVREGVRTAVVECGIGGEYDATNVLPAAAVSVSVVGALSRDHTSMLGESIASIAWHKSGIFREGVPAVALLPRSSQPTAPTVTKTLRDRAAEKGVSRLIEIPVDEVESGWREDFARGAKMEGSFAKFNMALASAAAAEHLRSTRAAGGDDGSASVPPAPTTPWTAASIPSPWLEAMKTASLRGHTEVLQRIKPGTAYYMDVAHTQDSLADAGRWFISRTTPAVAREGEEGKEGGGRTPVFRRALIFNQQDRDPEPLLSALLEAMGHRRGGGLAEGLDPDHPPVSYVVLSRNETRFRPGNEEPAALVMQNRAAAVAEEYGIPHGLATCASTARILADKGAGRQQQQQHGAPADVDVGVNILVTGSTYLVRGFLHGFGKKIRAGAQLVGRE